jgi:hypothetical protein
MNSIKRIKMGILAVAATLSLTAVPAFAQDFHFRGGMERTAVQSEQDFHFRHGGEFSWGKGLPARAADERPSLNFTKQGGGMQFNFTMKRGGIQGDLGLTSEPTPVALLLPAVQAAREAARR